MIKVRIKTTVDFTLMRDGIDGFLQPDWNRESFLAQELVEFEIRRVKVTLEKELGARVNVFVVPSLAQAEAFSRHCGRRLVGLDAGAESHAIEALLAVVFEQTSIIDHVLESKETLDLIHASERRFLQLIAV